MAERWGEKIGWIAGWAGSFLWVAILAAILGWRGQLAGAALGGVLVVAVAVGIVALAPWRHATTPMWRLMTPLLLLAAVAAVWALRYFPGAGVGGWGPWWSYLWLLPLLGLLVWAGRARWSDRQ